MSRTASSTSGCESFSRGLLTESGKIGQQREVQVGLAIGEETHFEIVDQLAHLLFVQQQRRHGHQRGAIGGNALAEIELGQRLRIDERCDGVVDQVDGVLRGRNQQQKEGRRSDRRSAQSRAPRETARRR